MTKKTVTKPVTPINEFTFYHKNNNNKWGTDWRTKTCCGTAWNHTDQGKNPCVPRGPHPTG